MRLLFAIVPACIVVAGSGLQAQSPSMPRTTLEATAGGELESYLRVLQGSSSLALRPWSVRPFTPGEADRIFRADTAHPWALRFSTGHHSATRLLVLRPSAVARYNTGLPVGGNEWGVWSGRGLTTTVRGGIALRAGPLTMRIEPILARAENSDFAIVPVGDSTVSEYSDPQFPTRIDLPQRFGSNAYVQLLPGESHLTLEGGGAMIGVSTASEWWGPAQTFPFLLSNNAGGFPRVTAGTTRPLSIGIGRVELRYLVGILYQSAYFQPRTIARKRRVSNALIAVFQPRGLRGLELGVGRFFHVPYPDGGLRTRDFTRVFETPFKSGIDSLNVDTGTGDNQSRDGENQLASVFLRWVAPHGLEVHAEAGREDHAWDLRELMVLPDRQMSIGFGLRRTWAPASQLRRVVRFEQLSFLQNSASRLGHAFSNTTYIHNSGSNQGHTSRGLLLGANLGAGNASGTDLSFDAYDPGGRQTLGIQRTVRRGQRAFSPDGTRNRRAYDTRYMVSGERLWLGRALDMQITAYGVYNFNRDFDGDVVSLGLRLAVWPGA